MPLRKSLLVLALLSIVPVVHAAESKWAMVSGEICNLRSGSSSSNKKIEVLSRFSPVKPLGEIKNGYLKVKTAGGKTGWAHETVLQPINYVSIAKDLKMRIGPSKSYEELYLLEEMIGYPFQVKDRKNDYVQVVDYLGDAGWVHHSLISLKPTCIVKIEKANLRVGPDIKYDVGAEAQKGVIFKILFRKGDWLQVRHIDGATGWISRKIVWGAVDIPEIEEPKKTTTKPGAKPAVSTKKTSPTVTTKAPESAAATQKAEMPKKP